MSRRAVFFDRDGVLNESIVVGERAYAPTTLSEFRLVSDAGRQVERLRSAGLFCFVFTNQPEIARGTLSRETLEAMHRRLRADVAVNDILVCDHDPADGCVCHKPRPGMLLKAAERWGIELSESFVIGNRWRDIEAGRAIGCFTILIQRPYSQCSTADACIASLDDAVDVIVERLGGAA